MDQRHGGSFLIRDFIPAEIFVPEDFTAEDLLIGKTASDFLRTEALPNVERIEQGDHELMAGLMRSAGALGLLAADVPAVYGGLELSQPVSALIAEKINWQQSFALTHEAHTVIGTLPLLFFGNHDQKSRYLPKLASGEWIASFALSEASSGSDALAAQTRATLSSDGSRYLLNGVKMWITNTAFAQLFTVFARVDGERFTAFLVERDSPGLSFGKEERKLGMHGTSTRRVIMENTPVPIANAMEVGKGQYAAFCALNLGRFKLEAGAVGGLKETLAVCARYSSQRKAFGKTIAEFGLIRHKLAEMAARTFALESMVYRLAGDLQGVFSGIAADAPDASRNFHRAAEEYAIECNIVKVIGSETYSAMTDEAIQIHGGYGYTEEFPVARAWRDQRLLRIGEGANEIVRLAIVNTLLRRRRENRLDLDTATARAHAAIDGATAAGPANALESAALQTRRAGLLLLSAAETSLGDSLMESQEIVAAIADVLAGAYALQSMWLRCARLSDAGHAHSAAALMAGMVSGYDLTTDAARSAAFLRDAAIPAAGELATLLDDTARRFGNPVSLRRELAAEALSKGCYPLN
ncbi:MAG TPA: acyl-CoA dehydrogenase family protein [Chthonomonadales bacterium]|nr:acyl-CoA dehydrogenase family protein [Chthonomonadales bacterium]